MMKGLSAILWSLLTLLTLMRCSPNTAWGGGSGTETVGMYGKVVDSQGQPITDAVITFKRYNGDTLLDSAITYSSPSGLNIGKYYLDDAQDGTYRIEMTAQDSLLSLFKRVSFTRGTGMTYIGTDTMLPPGSISGKVLRSGSTNHEGTLIYIPGTSYAAWSDTDGTFRMTRVPAGAYPVSFNYPDFLRMQLTDILVISEMETDIGEFILEFDPSQKPPRPGNLTVHYDTLSSTAFLSWNRVQVADLQGYAIYLDTGSVDLKPLSEIHNDTTYQDTVFSNPADTAALQRSYIVRAYDQDRTLSDNSNKVTITAVSPAVWATRFHWSLLPGASDTITNRDTVAIGVLFENRVRDIDSIVWLLNDDPVPIRSRLVGKRSAGDTLRYRFNTIGYNTLRIIAHDQTGATTASDFRLIIQDSSIILLESDRWYPFASMRVARLYPTAGVFENRIFVAGGKTSWFGRTMYTDSTSEFVTIPDTTWISGPAMAAGRFGASVLLLDDKLHLIGGQNQAQAIFASRETYDFSLNQWAAVFPLTSQTLTQSLFSFNTRIYGAGGGSPSTGFLPIVVYDDNIDTWEFSTALTTPRIDHQSVMLNDEIYILGGQSEWGEGISATEIFNPADNSLRSGIDMPTPRSSFGAAVVKGKIYVIGGYDQMSGRIINSVDAYDPATRQWTACASLERGRFGFATVVCNDLIYIIGGSEADTYSINATPVKTVMRYVP